MNFSRRIVEVVGWIGMVQDRNKRQALMDVAKKLLSFIKCGEFL
jgi:hypothetical protein